jgi:hypothetical protein
MKVNMNKKRHNKEKIKQVSLIVSACLSTILFFQNCNSNSGGIGSSSTSTTTPPPPPPPPPPVIPVTCPRTSNTPPVVTSLSTTNLSFNIGMGLDAGTERPRSLTVNFSSGDAYSAVVDVNCQVQNNAGLQVTCNAPNTPTANGSMQISINAANGEECRSGTVTVNVTVDDRVVNAQNQVITACNSIAGTSAARTFTVNVVNSCLAFQRMNPTNPYSAGQMGRTVAIDNDWAVSVAPGDEQRGQDAGAAYVMRRTNTTWAITQKLIPSTLAAGNQLTGAAISGNTLVLSAPLANSSTGAAWIYQFNGSQWVEVKTLVPPTTLSLFGASLAISGTNVAVGAPWANLGGGRLSGAVYVFSGADWNSLTTLGPSGSTLISGEFGTSIAYSGTQLVVGAPFPNSATTRLEAVYIFDNNTLQRKITNTANAAHRFGFAVALDGANLVVGAPYHTNERGIAYLFQSAAGQFPATATRQYVLADPNQDDIDHFGYSVAVKGTRIVVGAPDKAEASPKFGAAYLFGTGATTQLYKIRSPAVDRDADSFSYSIGLSADGWLISGALNDEHQAGIDNSGSAYLVRLP